MSSLPTDLQRDLQTDSSVLEKSFDKISKHDLRILIQKSKGNPQDVSLRRLLLRRLWDHERFKDFYDLLPAIDTKEIAKEIGAGDLQKLLRLHAKALFRVATSESSSLKKLIPIALSYCNFLKPNESQVLLDLLATLVQKKNNPQLSKYHSALLALMERVDECFKAQGLSAGPELRLAPEVAAKTSFREKIHSYLSQTNSEDSPYYLNGGHYLLLAQSGYFSDLDNRNHSLLDPDMNLCLEAIRIFYSLSFSSSKNLEQQLKPTYAALRKNAWAQLFFLQCVSEKIDFFTKQKATLDSKEIYRISMEMHKFVELLIQNIPDAHLSLGAASVFCCCEILESAPKADILITLKALTAIDDLLKKVGHPKDIGALKKCKEGIELLSIDRFVDQIDKKALSDVLFRKGPKSCEESSRTYFLECVDEFVSLNDPKHGFLHFGNSHTQTLLKKSDLFLTLLESFGAQKKRINKLRKIERQLMGEL